MTRRNRDRQAGSLFQHQRYVCCLCRPFLPQPRTASPPLAPPPAQHRSTVHPGRPVLPAPPPPPHPEPPESGLPSSSTLRPRQPPGPPRLSNQDPTTPRHPQLRAAKRLPTARTLSLTRVPLRTPSPTEPRNIGCTPRRPTPNATWRRAPKTSRAPPAVLSRPWVLPPTPMALSTPPTLVPQISRPHGTHPDTHAPQAEDIPAYAGILDPAPATQGPGFPPHPPRR